jgi:uncharacterized membrane protein
MKDSSKPLRSFVKAVSWETISTLATFGLAWLMFGQVRTCVVFASVSYVLKLVMFYGHERVWHKFTWGKLK